MEAILVDRTLPRARKRQAYAGGNEIVYIAEGSVIFEAQGKPQDPEAGESFTTVAAKYTT